MRGIADSSAGAVALGLFGEKLRRQREKRGIALEAISNTTKISTRMLRALEEEHFDQLPGGVFNKGFVRAYARQVGLDEEEAVTDYLAALRESQIHSEKILPDFRNPPRNGDDFALAEPALQNRHKAGINGEVGKQDSSKTSLPKNDVRPNDPVDPVRPGANGSDDIDNVIVADRRRQSRRGQDRRAGEWSNNAEGDRFPTQASFPVFAGYTLGQDQARPAGRSTVPWGKLAAVLLLILAALAFWNLRRQSSLTAEPRPGAPTQASNAAVPAPSQTADAKTLSASAHRVLNGTSADPPPVAPVTPKAAPSPSPSPSTVLAASPKDTVLVRSHAVKPPSSFRVTIRAEKTAWVSITADGKPVAEETLIAPAVTSVRASREIVVRARNAAGITFLFNQKEIPAQGGDGEIQTYTFDSTGMKKLP